MGILLLQAEIADLDTAFGMPDGTDDLLLRAFRLLHRSPPFKRDRRRRHRALVKTCGRFPGRRRDYRVFQQGTG